MKHVKIGAIVLLAVAILVVILQNTESVETRVLVVTLTMPRAVLLFVTLLLGWLVGVLSGMRFARRGVDA